VSAEKKDGKDDEPAYPPVGLGVLFRFMDGAALTTAPPPFRSAVHTLPPRYKNRAGREAE
jgi:hypothetical protein